MVISLKKSGWFGNSKRHAAIGRKGGLVTAKRGMSYFQTIGRLGGLKKKKKTA
ncbi:hypothetical protein HY345_04655 [Candidatus Microgenomates bacterium]|nr:hypothetical protein [Candidatus Microgenomates bacterium]